MVHLILILLTIQIWENVIPTRSVHAVFGITCWCFVFKSLLHVDTTFFWTQIKRSVYRSYGKKTMNTIFFNIHTCYVEFIDFGAFKCWSSQHHRFGFPCPWSASAAQLCTSIFYTRLGLHINASCAATGLRCDVFDRCLSLSNINEKVSNYRNG